MNAVKDLRVIDAEERKELVENLKVNNTATEVTAL